MNELITKLGIDWKLLLSQIINFFILLFVLHRLLYKPVLKILDKRSQKIAESIKKAEEIEKREKEMQEECQKILHNAKQLADDILQKASVSTARLQKEAEQKTELKNQELIIQAKAEIESEKKRIKDDLKEEIANLVLAATEKIITKQSDANLSRREIDRALEEVKTNY